ncbi:MAG: MmgE/PrpD family protein [Desulfobacteraceae bacterium 4572_187]|nr:MAG: MmgE/PrpD family protein [Desulfobacteraceae bacterium 4572_187]
MSISRTLAEYIVDISYKDLPPEVIRCSKLCIFDWLGVALGGSVEEVSPILIDFIQEMGGKKQATVLGSRLKTNVLSAVLVNGTMSHALDFDDTHTAASIHPSVCVAPAATSVAEYKKLTGKDLITAFTLGFEIATRIGSAAGLSHYELGWHATSTVGRFGAAVATAKLLKLTPDEIVNALGIAGTQIGGLREVFGTMCKPFQAGKAAMDGVMSAFLAKKGFDSSEKIFEGRYGVGNVYAANADRDKLLAGLGGTDFQITRVVFKRYASALATHSAIEAVKEIRERENITAEDVGEINIELGSLPMSVVDIRDPKRVLEAKFSIHHCVALAFIEGSAGQYMFTRKKLGDPKLADFREKVNARLNRNFSRFETKTIITTKNGKTFEKFIPVPKGSPENPVTFEEMKNKFKSLVYPILSREKARQIFFAIKNLEESFDVGELMAMCVSKEGSGKPFQTFGKQRRKKDIEG